MSSFITEKKLVRDFIDTLNRTILTDELMFFEEFEATNGIADIVLVQLNKNSPQIKALAELSPRLLTVFGSLKLNEVIDFSSLSKKSGLSFESSKKSLRKILSMGLIEEISSSTYLKKQDVPIITKEICAIEAKLRDWRRALLQAYRYQNFANKSWVLLDEKNISSARKNIQHFENLNVGLASFNIHREIRIYFEPKLTDPKFGQSIWHANHLIANQLA